MTTAIRPRRSRARTAAIRQQRRDTFWSAKQAAAATPKEQAAVTWDRLRHTVGRLPEDRQAAQWARIQQLLEQIRSGVESHAP